MAYNVTGLLLYRDPYFIWELLSPHAAVSLCMRVVSWMGYVNTISDLTEVVTNSCQTVWWLYNHSNSFLFEEHWSSLQPECRWKFSEYIFCTTVLLEEHLVVSSSFSQILLQIDTFLTTQIICFAGMKDSVVCAEHFSCCHRRYWYLL